MDSLSQEDYRTILESLPTGVYLVDRERRILLWSTGAEELTGYLRAEVIGRPCRDDLLMHSDSCNSVICGQSCPLQQTMHDGHPRVAEVFLLHKDGRRIPVSVHAAPWRNEQGSIIGAVECFEKRMVYPAVDPQLRALSRNATIDRNTGLPDQQALETALQTYLNVYRTSSLPFGVLCLEVNGIEGVRHFDGRNAGDAISRAAGKSLAASLGPADIIGCWSRDRFVAVVAGCTAPALSRVAEELRRLIHMVRVPWWGERLKVELSAGGTLVRLGDTPPDLIARAEASLEASKERGEFVPLD